MEILQFTYSLGHPASLGGLFCAIGNPLNDGTWTYTWEKGRQLKSMSKSGTTASFKYNENGLRIQKVATSTGTTNYTLHGKNIVHMTQGSNNLHFFYDASNKPAIVDFNGTKYAYVHNLQGDIVAILDSNGNKVVEYKYDAWGTPFTPTGSMKDSLGKLNPFRYRGYVYDEETGLYYLQTRYYSPENVRFLNADVFVSTGHGILDSNMYNYCWSNPVVLSDSAGTDPLTQTLADDSTPWDDHENFGCGGGGAGGGWGGTWQATMRTLQGAADGFAMAAGQRNLSFSEKHHLFSDKNPKYTPLYQKTFDKYGVSLNDSKNIVPVDGHRGRHSNTYHQMMLFAINMLDGVADGNCDIFTNGLDELGVYIQQNWWMPYIK